MAMTILEIEDEIRALALSEKGKILKHLIAEIDGPVDEGVEEAWLVEAKMRYDELKKGKVTPISYEKVISKARDRLRDES